MSTGLVPLPGKLLENKRVKAEAALGCISAVPTVPNPPGIDLYRWANDILNQLVVRGDHNPKLKIAESLDIPSEDCWRGCNSTQRNTPRHRVVARFARESLWLHIWSLNWDCVQESALENVGIKRGGVAGLMPWPVAFNTFVTADQCSQMGEANTIKVIKPHGCVMALVDAQTEKAKGNTLRSISLSERFLITETELNHLAPTVADGAEQQYIFAALVTALASHPFIVAGWSVSEPYLINQIKLKVEPLLRNPHRHPPLEKDEVSIISRRFNPDGHTALANCYGRDEAAAHINVGQPGLDQDQLFLWLQTLYAIHFLRQRAPVLDQPALDTLNAELDQPPNNPSFAINWVDNFLPVWIRLCWRSGLVIWENSNGQRVEINDVALESRDEHIPWHLSGSPRPELIAASRILAALHRSGGGMNWDYDQFPGGFYRNFRLIIPIPIWASDPPNDLRGLKPLIDAIKQHGAGYIERVALVFVSPDPASVISDVTKRVWKQLVARDLSMARFAKADAIEDIQLEDL